MSDSDPLSTDPTTRLAKRFSIHDESSTIQVDTKNKECLALKIDTIPLVSSKLSNIQPDRKRMKTTGHHEASMDSLIAKLSAQQAIIDEQKNTLSSASLVVSPIEQSDSASDSFRVTPATEIFSDILVTDASEDDQKASTEIDRLREELKEAKNKLARQEFEFKRAMNIPEACINVQQDQLADRVNNIAGTNNNVRQNPAGIFSSNLETCGGGVQGYYSLSGVQDDSKSRWLNRPLAPNLPQLMVPQLPQQIQAISSRTSQNTRNAAVGFSGRGRGWDELPIVNMNPQFQPTGMLHAPSLGPVGYQPRPIGTPLSPGTSDFGGGSATGGPWNSTPSSPAQSYITPMEPLNYRRLLDRSVNCNWKYIVDKIVCNNDQQASIFLQQKLKVGTVEQKYEIVEAIVAQAYPLMVNRFGNFLVQRCFEHGTPEQVVAIANAIRGNTLSLSMDAFGCHVVQKAFDAVPEEYKAIMVHELLRRIPETVIHRYACHVWQKLFELRWSDSPPQIMKYVNDSLRGMWHEVALGETGSLVVQNIFENCLEEDKRPCINEVLDSIDIVAHGQFGNWCIQHICEHGAPADRNRAIDHVLRYATEYSMDQFASKVVEKCLKIGGNDFLERYLERVCEGREDRPRIPLIDISSDQYGNYLIQYILTHSNTQHREIVASHIRKHMVSLRGSKFGSRVGMLCSNPAYATRPGPGAGAPTNRFNNGVVTTGITNNSSSNRFPAQFR